MKGFDTLVNYFIASESYHWCKGFGCSDYLCGFKQQLSLVLFDLTGKELIKTTLPDYAYIGYMDVSHLAAGMYILQLRQRGGVLKSEKVVVER